MPIDSEVDADAISTDAIGSLVILNLPKYRYVFVQEWLAAISCISSRHSACAVASDGATARFPPRNIMFVACSNSFTPASRGSSVGSANSFEYGAASAHIASTRYCGTRSYVRLPENEGL